MPDPTTQLGVAGVIVALLSIGIVTLWKALQAERAARNADQAAILPALTQSTAAVASAVLAIDRITVLADRRPFGNGEGR